MGLIWQLNWFFKQYWRRYGVAIVILAIVAIIQTRVPALIGSMIDTIVHSSREEVWSDFQPQLYQLLFIGVLVYILRYIWRVALYGAAYRLGHILRQKLYQHYLNMDATFFQEQRAGKLIAHVTNDIQAVEMTAGEGILTLVDSMMIGCLVLAIMTTHYSWQLTLISLLPLPIMAFLVARIGRQIHSGFTEAQAAFSEVNNVAHENISGIRTVRLFAAEHYAQEMMQQTAESASQANMKVAGADAKFDPVIYLCIGCAYLFTLSGGSWLIHEKILTIGELTSFSLYLGQLIWPMFAIAWLFNILERGSAAYHRIQNVLNMQAEIHSGTNRTPIIQPSIQIEQLSFAIDKRAILTDVNFTISPGHFIGIVGPTGSGKTTLLRLLQRFIEASHGLITINGTSLPEFDLATLRQCFAYVPQDPYLFSMSVAGNLKIGAPQASQTQLEWATKLADIHEDIIRLPNGYDTQVGERGITLSGGQKQRLSIARALLSQKPVLLLDDALSAVDSKTAHQILNNLSRQSLTTVMISHRLQGLESASQILVLDRGKIREQGSHQTLLDAHDWYAKTWLYQQIEQALDEEAND